MQKDILQTVKLYIGHHHLINDQSKIIVGLSGGSDSVALLHILHNLGYLCVAAHCNFHLRGEESDRDMEFVTQLSKKWNVQLETVHFNTTLYAQKQHMSIEMAARDLRYSWFEEIRKKHEAQYIAIAHHSDDALETFFINLTRGTGLRGLTGIRPQNGKIVRPLLCLSRHDILEYLSEMGQDYVTDSTNADSTIIRNKFRNQVIPAIESINPAFRKVMQQTLNHLQNCEEIIDETTEKIRQSIEKDIDGNSVIELDTIYRKNNYKFILFELLHKFGFSSSAISDLAECKLNDSGQSFYSDKYILLKDRNRIIITTPKATDKEDIYTLEQKNQTISVPIGLRIEIIDNSDVLKINKTENHCYIDAQKVTGLLKIRHWENGDTFYPFGMNQKKKVSDFFINSKMSNLQKQNQWILTAENGIVWIIGKRSDNRFRIDNQTSKIIHFELIK
jgi:tRNA(Ile)-lysidine synthase